MRAPKILVLVLTLAAGVALSACEINTSADGGFNLGITRGSASDTWTRSYPLAAGGRLELVNVNGRIDAEPASGDTVELVGVRTAKASSDEAATEILDRVEMREEVGDNRVRVEVRPPHLSGLSGQEVKWTVKLPKGVHVDLRTTNGGVRMRGLDGEIHARSINGGVTGRDLRAGAIEASTVNGGVDMELVSPLPADGHVELECVNGGVSLQLPDGSKATISARAVNGGVSAGDLDVDKTGDDNGRRRLEGTLNGGGARVALQTTNGGVRLGSSKAKPTR